MRLFVQEPMKTMSTFWPSSGSPGWRSMYCERLLERAPAGVVGGVARGGERAP